jgi:hypothetical protein
MRFSKTSSLLISEDLATEPKKIFFKREIQTSDLGEILKEIVVRSETFPTGSHTINLNNIAEGRWFYLYAENDVSVQFNGGSALTLRAKKEHELWATITSLVINTTEDTVVTVAIAGE